MGLMTGVGSMLTDFTGSVSAALTGYMSSIVTVPVAGALMGSALTGVGVGSAVASFFFHLRRPILCCLCFARNSTRHRWHG